MLTNEQEATSDVNTDKILVFLNDILIIADIIFSICHIPDSYLTDTELDDAEETIEIMSRLWQEAELSVTVKAHIIHTHPMLFLRRFRGMSEYDK